MRPISPNTGAPEAVVAEEQEEYRPLSVAFYQHQDGSRLLVTAWVPQREELERLARELAAALRISSADALLGLQQLFRVHPVYVTQKNFGTPMTPLIVSAGAEDWMRTAEVAGG